MEIYTNENLPGTLFPIVAVETDPALARRVRRSFPKKLGPLAEGLIQRMFLTCHLQKELAIIEFLHCAYPIGPKALAMYQNPALSTIHKSVQYLEGEAHLLKEFLRFRDTGAGLVAQIKPKNMVLPLLRGHFCDRLPEERFLILDMTHQMALYYQPYEAKIIPAEWVETPPDNGQETFYQTLWKRFYLTAGVKGRENPLCRRNRMPKRYWDCLTEFSELMLTETPGGVPAAVRSLEQNGSLPQEIKKLQGLCDFTL